MISDALALYKFIDEKLEHASVFSALFSWTADRKEGDDVIKVHKVLVSGKEHMWFYSIEPYKDYIFIPFPVNPTVNVDFGVSPGEKNPDVKYFRYVSSPMARYSSGGEGNVKVDFFVFGYKPSDLMQRRKKQA